MTKPKIVMANEHGAVCLVLYVPAARLQVLAGSLDFIKAKALAGGWSTRHIEGGWVSPDGDCIVEPVHEIEFLVPADKTAAVAVYLRRVSEALLHAGEQAVLVANKGAVQLTTYTLS